MKIAEWFCLHLSIPQCTQFRHNEVYAGQDQFLVSSATRRAFDLSRVDNCSFDISAFQGP